MRLAVGPPVVAIVLQAHVVGFRRYNVFPPVIGYSTYRSFTAS